MNKKTTLFLSVLLIAFSSQAKTYDIRALGADPTGQVLCTEIIHSAIEQASAEGGGTLYFPAGTYLTGPIHLKSNLTLHVESGALLRFSDRFEDYLPFVPVRWEGVFMRSFSPLIYAHGAENITLTGRGVLDGQGARWWKTHREIAVEIRDKGDILSPNALQQLWDRENPDITVSDYYRNTLKRRFFRPPFIQFLECRNVHIENLTLRNSPFWTINPEGCDDLLIQGVTIHNPEAGPNTDGINPSSCSNVRIANCFISVGDDCITIKSGRDADGRAYGRPCQNITITNCVMLSGHGGVVIGSEMSGGVKKVAISNCIFDGTDAGIRLKASRGRGGQVEAVRVDNIVMNNIQKNAFIFDLFYDRSSQAEPVSERTPIFRNIHLSNITGNDIKKIGYITGLEEMPIQEISFTNINLTAATGFTARAGSRLRFHNVDFAVSEGPSIALTDCQDVVLDDIRSRSPQPGQAIIELTNVDNALLTHCFQITPADLFLRTVNSQIHWGDNWLVNVKEEKQED